MPIWPSLSSLIDGADIKTADTTFFSEMGLLSLRFQKKFQENTFLWLS